MSDPRTTPPPPERMPEATKDRIRAELSAAAGQQEPAKRGSGSRWMAPSLAAAAVLTVVGGAFAIAASSGDSGDSGLGPAASPSTSAPQSTESSSRPPVTTNPAPSRPPVTTNPAPSRPPVTTNPAPSRPPVTTNPAPSRPPGTTNPPPSLPPSVPPTTSVSRGAPSGAPAATEPPTGSSQVVTTCKRAIHELVGYPSLRGAAVTAERDYGPGRTYLYETKTAWVMCDSLSALGGGAPTLFAVHDKTQPYKPDASTLAVSGNTITNPDGSWRYRQFVAGGRDFDGVRSISYVFPDGHVEHAVVGKTGLWSMVYLPTGGVFMDPHTNETRLNPIKVKVHYTSGWVQVLPLRWGFDTCAQINHGC